MRKTALVGGVIGTLWSVAAFAVATVTIVRISDSAGCSQQPSMNATGRHVAFASEGDLVPGGNADGNFEIFVFDRKAGLTQITDTTGGDNIEPAIDGSGAHIAFLSDRDLVPGKNADGNQEIFLFDRKRGFTQITDTMGGVTGPPVISSNGARIAFASDRDLVPGGNADGNSEIFLFDRKLGFTQVTNTTVNANDAPAISRDASSIAFISTADLTGGNADSSAEVFLFRRKKGFTQITDGSGCGTTGPAISKSGARIAFASTCDLVAGGNADANSEIFLFDRRRGLSQITATTAGFNDKAAVDSGGNRVAFVSDRDLVPGGNPDGNLEIFLFSRRNGFLQITASTGGNPDVPAAPALSSSGKRIAFELSGELTPGSNPDSEGEVYVAKTR